MAASAYDEDSKSKYDSRTMSRMSKYELEKLNICFHCRLNLDTKFDHRKKDCLAITIVDAKRRIIEVRGQQYEYIYTICGEKCSSISYVNGCLQEPCAHSNDHRHLLKVTFPDSPGFSIVNVHSVNDVEHFCPV